MCAALGNLDDDDDDDDDVDIIGAEKSIRKNFSFRESGLL
jgi:hypothetical protein